MKDEEYERCGLPLVKWVIKGNERSGFDDYEI